MRRVIIGLLLIFLSSPVYSLTLSSIRNEIRELNRDDQATSTRQRWDNTELEKRINIAQKDIVAETRCLDARIRITTIADQREYILPNIVGEITRVSYSNSDDTTTYRRLPRVNFSKLDRDDSDWDDESSGEPDCYYTRKACRVGLSPPPSSDYVGTSYLQIDCVYIPADLDEDTDVPFNDRKSLYPYHQLIVWYVCHLCMLEIGNIQMAQHYNNLYLVGMERLKKDLKTEEDNYDYGKISPRVR